jgi:hypothetical protein
VKGAAHVFRDALHAVDLRHPFRHLAVHAAVIDFLEGFALGELVADLADEDDHRGRILEAGMDPDRAVGAPGPRVTKSTPGSPVSLP